MNSKQTFAFALAGRPARLLVALLAAAAVGCAGPPASRTKASVTPTAGAEVQTDQLAVRLIAVLDPGAPGTLVKASGWRDFQIEITNLGNQPMTVRVVKLRNSAGRYFASAEDVAELDDPPDVTTQVAGDVAMRGVGIAAGQAIPYGGTLVGILSGAARANAQQDRAARERRFEVRNLNDVELAPGASFSGSAYLPEVQSPTAIAVDWRTLDGKTERLELPLPRAAVRHTASP